MRHALAYIIAFCILSPYAAPAVATVAEAFSDRAAYSCRMDCCGDNCDCTDQTENDSESQGCKSFFCTGNSSLAILDSGQVWLAFDLSIYEPFPSHQRVTLLPSLIDHPPKSLV